MKLLKGGSEKPGRNDSCSCGSGLKYKKCCWEKDAAAKMNYPVKTALSKNLLNPSSMKMEMQAMMGQIKEIVEKKGLSIEKAGDYFVGRTMDEIAAEAKSFKRTNQEQALDFAYQAHSARTGKQAVLMAQRALDLDANCAEAILILEEHLAHDDVESIQFYEKAIAAATKSLGDKFFEENVGHFWGLHESRAYMRAKFGLAQSLWNIYRQSEAIEICWALLKLNPNDNQGARYVLFDYLLTDNRLSDVAKLVKLFKNEGSAHWEYNLTLYHFKKDGPDSAAAKQCAAQAYESNKFVVDFLAGKSKIPKESPNSYSPGSKEEALCYAEDSMTAWLNTPGSNAWLGSLSLNGGVKKKAKKASPKSRGH